MTSSSSTVQSERGRIGQTLVCEEQKRAYDVHSNKSDQFSATPSLSCLPAQVSLTVRSTLSTTSRVRVLVRWPVELSTTLDLRLVTTVRLLFVTAIRVAAVVSSGGVVVSVGGLVVSIRVGVAIAVVSVVVVVDVVVALCDGCR